LPQKKLKEIERANNEDRREIQTKKQQKTSVFLNRSHIQAFGDTSVRDDTHLLQILADARLAEIGPMLKLRPDVQMRPMVGARQK
jgi:hypothetical protein